MSSAQLVIKSNELQRFDSSPLEPLAEAVECARTELAEDTPESESSEGAAVTILGLLKEEAFNETL
jgi:hypothetical protein